jgi:tRNA/tmRNA/rRNA uracil-C5-methylase (TrmA/RlmC/RlmD family)
VTELTLERIVHGGVCLARLPEGRLALIRGGIPGERIRSNLSEKSGVLRGEVDEIIEASPDRISGTRHPGLDFDHISYARQLQLKQEVLVDALGRALATGGQGSRDSAAAELIQPVTPSPAEWRYRNTVQPVVTAEGLGYRLPLSHRTQTLVDDPVANEAIRSAWSLLLGEGLPKGVREVAFRGNDQGEALVALIASGPARELLDYAHGLVQKGISGVSYARFDRRGRFRGGSERLAGERRLMQRFGDYDLTVTAVSFAQPNPAAASLLYADLVELAGSGRHAYDLYAGGGPIALHLARSFAQVTAVEIDRGSVARGRADARRLGIDNVSFDGTDVRFGSISPDADLITVDPPRAGLGQDVRTAIDESSARQLIYVSCDPATWARDVAAFSELGWTLDFIRPFDFYPQTHHVEILSRLTR